MIVLFWNIRGLGQEGRRGQLREIMNKYKIYVVCLQETIKKEYNISELRELSNNQPFSWNWVEAKGHSGGILIGVKQGDLDATEMSNGEFQSSIKIKDQRDGFQWEIINVYGPVQIERKASFLQELFRKIQEADVPLLIGGDFNMIRYAHEKSNENLHWNWMENFNAFIDDTTIREIYRGGNRFTWTNKQEAPIMSNLDRAFMTPEWEEKYPRTTMKSLLRVGSYHSPILVDIGDQRPQKIYPFRFEMAWLTQEKFKEKLLQKWPETKEQDILDYWKRCIIELRKFCRGWGRNTDCAMRKENEPLIQEIKKFDEMAEGTEADQIQWKRIYEMEAKLEQIYTYEEIRWQRRGGETWLLKGDSNT